MMPPERLCRNVSDDSLAGAVGTLLDDGFRLALVAAHDDGAVLRVVYLLLAGQPDRRVELTLTIDAGDPAVPSLAHLSIPAGRFEREMMDLYGIAPQGHPQPRRLVSHAHWPSDWYPMRHNASAPTEFATVGVSVRHRRRPRGVRDPGRAGPRRTDRARALPLFGDRESVLRLKARLWFVHRGIEKLFEGRPAAGAVGMAERISGDTSAAHALAHSLAVEEALGYQAPDALHRLRALLVELERLYNHATDLGALANDVGFALANSHAQRVRELVLRINHRVTGHRLLRGAIRPGGVVLQQLPEPVELRALAVDVAEIAALTLGNSVIYDRFADTAVLKRDDACAMGCLGYVARASGIGTDARLDHPTTPLPVEPVGRADGDVLARYLIRRDEFAASVALACTLIEEHHGPLQQVASLPAAGGSGVGIVEGWRGTIVHRVEVDAGVITRAKVVDPSWFNWPALPVAMADTIVPDFPLANKSFNLSYAGNDL